MTDEEIYSMFKKADIDDDGFVTFDDFYNIMTGRVYWDWFILYNKLNYKLIIVIQIYP